MGNSKKDRRRTILHPLELNKLWDSVNANLCKEFSTNERTTRSTFIVNSNVDFAIVASRIHTILAKLLQVLEESFPFVFNTNAIDVRYKPQRATRTSTRRTSLQKHSHTRSLQTRHVSNASTRRQTRTVNGNRWNCLGYSQTIDEWKKTPLTRTTPQMKNLIEALERCYTDSEEKFIVMPLTWSLVTKQNKPSSHYSCLVVDMSPQRTKTFEVMNVTIIDVNGYGSSSSAYKRVFSEPEMGLNPLIKIMITRIFDYARVKLGYKGLSVMFPAFTGINVKSEAVELSEKKDEKYFPGLKMINKNMEQGVCSIATLFVIIRLACDQRKALKEGIDTTLKRFTKNAEGGNAAYEHVLFIRSFTYNLLHFFDFDTPSYGIKGDRLKIAKHDGEWFASEMSE